MKALILVLILVCAGCAAKFDPKTDPDVAKIVEAINEDRVNIVSMKVGVNALVAELEKRSPGLIEKLKVRIQEIEKQNEGSKS